MSEPKETLLITVEIRPNETDEGWYLEVINSITGKTFDCQSLDEMNQNIETLYSLYPERELQVMWLPSHDARPEHIEEVRSQIGAIQKEMDEQKI